jgi:hypothetical protein
MTKNLDPRWLVTSQLKSAGGDPSLLFEIIENIIERRDWEKLPDGGDSGEPVGSFRRMIEAPPPIGCNLPAGKLLKMLEIDHRYEHQDAEIRERMTLLRENVGRLLNEELPILAKHGEIGNGRRVRTTNSTQSKDDSEYAIRRLKRDNPALAEAVIKGEKSANAAAIEAGFRPPRLTVRLDDMQSCAQNLARRLSSDQLDELIAQLVDYRGSK